MKLKRFLIGLFTICAFLLAQLPVQAGTNLTVDCSVGNESCSISPSGTPLFHEANLLPGDEVSQTTTFRNSGNQAGYIAVQLTETTDSAVADALTLEVMQEGTNGGTLYGPVALSAAQSFQTFTQVNPGDSIDITFIVRLPETVGNQYQGLTSAFTLDLGFELIQFKNTGSSGSSSSSSSGSSSASHAKPEPCTDTQPASAPQLSITSVGPNTVSLSWTGVSPVTHYALAFTRQRDGEQYGSPNIGNTTTYTVTNLSGGEAYRFEVFAVNGCAPGARSNAVSTGSVPGSQVSGRPLGAGGTVLGDDTAIQGEVGTGGPAEETETEGAVAGETTEEGADADSDTADASFSLPNPFAGLVAGLTTDQCRDWTPYLPGVLLLAQLVLVLGIEFIDRARHDRRKYFVGAGVTLAVIAVRSVFGNCDCFGTWSLLAWICQWFWVVAAMFYGLLRAISYAFIEEVDGIILPPKPPMEPPAKPSAKTPAEPAA